MVLTPIEEYKLKGKTVHVKRDDLVGNGTTLPRWAKIEGIRKILESDYIDKSKPLTHLSVYGSWTGWTLSKMCKEYGIEFISSYPDSKTYPPELLESPIDAGCPEDGVVLDPFFGSGTTAQVAMEQDKNWVGIELNPEFAELSHQRIKDQVPNTLDEHMSDE